MNIFAKLVHSVWDLRSYPAYRKSGGTEVFLYALFLNAVYFLAVVLIPMAGTLVLMGGLGNVMEEEIPDFSLKNDKLWVAETVDVQEYDRYQGGICIRIDTGEPITEQITDVDLVAFYQALVLDAEHGIAKMEGSPVIRFSYEDLGLGDFDRESLLKMVMPFLSAILGIVVILVMGFGFFGFFAGALVVAVLGSIMASFSGCRLKFGELYKLAVHTRTPALAVKCVCAWLPVAVPYLSVISFGISGIYMWTAIQYIKEEEGSGRQMYV